MTWAEWATLYLYGAGITGGMMVFHSATPNQPKLTIVISLILWPLTMFLMIGGLVERWWKRR